MNQKAPRQSGELSGNMKKLRREAKALMRELGKSCDEGRAPGEKESKRH